MAFVRSNRNPNSSGFTMIEMMITVAIVGILAAIALPSYFEFVTRSKIIDGTTKLGDFKSKMDKFFMDNRTYLNGGGTCGVANPLVSPSDYFAITCGPPGTCVAATATSYSICADGIAAKGMAGFRYTVDQTNAKSSTGPAGWAAAPTCWALRKDGSC
jgi:type IV pilus assembly protein PilE